MRPKICEISLRVPQKDIYYISWTIDACEGLGFLKTDDARNGEVTVFTPAELLGDMKECIEGLKSEGLDIVITAIRETAGETE
ncbi:MAG TPA: DUF4911 domain-containing protein [Synergistaceae bacterium]|nr:DUF4911 domain-containing protein [Synergistaceae bacterium]NLL41370.1 DUF4911 domain-containing protein [Synergistaceae bacterium]HPX03375.1 DUF4911 domain-containing protein [Synergistaceae bacterium]HQA55193.1 DUF4911 domain-containing protein [Synergistaceae bacterium]